MRSGKRSARGRDLGERAIRVGGEERYKVFSIC